MLQGPQGGNVRGGLAEMCADTAHLAEQVKQVNHQIEDVGQAWHMCEAAELQSRHQVAAVVTHDHARLEAQRRKPEVGLLCQTLQQLGDRVPLIT
ncbi:hypothetical protein GDO78_014567 [Eleutherodactylus coqui]|uniref:Uncharacterized protein n=1 Tax=Eleutherodactylus coqui TaxID=57060 RepID=A0A8J6E6R5_ELECQ|nr:hypothetical protein GDO78_014567 [Eleutherodactylus coqui]